MLSHPRSQRFLLDENTRTELKSFLKTSGSNVKVVSKTASDLQIAAISLKEKRILVTSDQDFLEYSKDQIFSVVLLKLPQSDPISLLNHFNNLMFSIKSFKGKRIILKTSGIELSILKSRP